MNSVGNFLRFIRFSHTIFALPFALGAMFVAAQGLPDGRTLAGILAAMVCARTAAMTFNRIVDWELDKRNPRTAGRHLLLDRRVASGWCVAASLGFVLSSAALNWLCFLLSPVALGMVFFYSLTKRFTASAHFFLGLALAVAPVGAWLAVTGTWALPPFVLAGAVVFWVAGFDLIYATQDVEVDRREGLHSLVVRLGVPGALRLAIWLHGAALAGLVAFGIVAGSGKIYFSSLILVVAALFYEHIEARRGEMPAIQRAFFHANAVVGLAFVLGTYIDSRVLL